MTSFEDLTKCSSREPIDSASHSTESRPGKSWENAAGNYGKIPHEWRFEWENRRKNTGLSVHCHVWWSEDIDQRIVVFFVWACLNMGSLFSMSSTVGILIILQIDVCDWRFPEMGVPPNHPNFTGIFHELNHPFWVPRFMETPDCLGIFPGYSHFKRHPYDDDPLESVLGPSRK